MKRIVLALLIGLSCAGCVTTERLHYAAPAMLPGVGQDMKRPGFWIARQQSPDKIVLNPQQIEAFNLQLIENLKFIKDISRFPASMSGNEFKKSQTEIIKSLRCQNLYLAGHSRAGDNFYRAIERNINLESVPGDIPVRFGFISSFANQRIIPTGEGLCEKPIDTDFDQLQNSGLDIGTPVAALHRSRDSKWYYVESPLSGGWVEADKIAFCELKEMESYARDHKPIVVTSRKADIYLDPEFKEYYGYVRMGAALAAGGKSDTHVAEVIVPLRENTGTASIKRCYMRNESVREGYLPYTARNIIQQAFELLNEPYGWGDIRGEQDCSRFIQQIFATTGIELPRNSAFQGKTGILIAEFDKTVSDNEKIEILKTKASGGLTLLYLSGHIMIYLGTVGDMPYAIHATSAYRENIAGRDRTRLINRVTVSDLSLGKGSSKGSLLERLIAIRLISNN